VNDPNSITLVAKKNGKTVFEQTRSVSSDGNTLSLKSTSHPKESDTTVETEVSFMRTAKAPAGANATSGSWRVKKVDESDAGLNTTYKWSGDELSMSQPTGENFKAKVDGKDYPFNGSYAYDTVSLKRIDDHTIEQTMKRGGEVIAVSRFTVSSDGHTLTEVATNKQTNRTSTFVSEKQDTEAQK
jgi:hypothetical protein